MVDSEDTTAPPPYSHAEAQNYDLPTYSTLPILHEHVLIKSDSQLPESFSTTRHQYRTSHMLVDLGTRRSPFRLPAYGLDATIEGSVTFSGDIRFIKRVSITLEGFLENSIPTLATASESHYNLPLISTSAILYQASPVNKDLPEKIVKFSMPIPRQQKDGSTLPPTFNTVLKNCATSGVRYHLRIDMVRKNWRLHEALTMAILYLPKSTPLYTPMTGDDMNRPIIFEDRMPFSLPRDRVTTSMLRPRTNPGAYGSSITRLNTNTIHISLPADLCFVSGETIPFILTLAFGANPDIVKLVLPHLAVTLYRRIYLQAHDSNVCSDVVIGQGRVHSSVERAEKGVVTLRGGVVAGSPGKECAWKVDPVASVSYYIRAVMNSPPDLQPFVPSVIHEEPCRLVSDGLGAYHRELLATGGIPTPALGTHRSPFYIP